MKSEMEIDHHTRDYVPYSEQCVGSLTSHKLSGTRLSYGLSFIVYRLESHYKSSIFSLTSFLKTPSVGPAGV